MAPEFLVERLHIAAAVALLMIGAVTALTAENVARRLVGLIIAFVAAALGLAALGAPAVLLIATIAAAGAMTVFGVALLIRLQEDYGGIETAEFDRADDVGEPTEPSA